MSRASQLALVLALWLLPMVAMATSTEKCNTCSQLAEAFGQGLERTAKANFGGGNTQWEESRLGSYATSETRLVDIVERLCSDKGKEEAVACHSVLEGLEDVIEGWWATQFRARPSADTAAGLRDFLCVAQAGLCCPYNTFGPDCAQCPSGDGGHCSGRGSCDGNGTRAGSGACACHHAYGGRDCAECAPGHFADAAVRPQACAPCHLACANCTGPAANHCLACATGYHPASPPADGQPITCEDVDECQSQCAGQHEVCSNSPGSFSCDCETGYRRVGGDCQPVPDDKDDGAGKEGEGAGKEEGEDAGKEGEAAGKEEGEDAGKEGEAAGKEEGEGAGKEGEAAGKEEGEAAGKEEGEGAGKEEESAAREAASRDEL